MKIQSNKPQKTTQQVAEKTTSKIKLKLKQRISFYRELSGLVDAGVDLNGALSLMEEGHQNDALSWIARLKANVVKGDSLADSFSKLGIFSNFEIESIRAAEQAGMLNEVLNSLLNYFDYRFKLERTIKGAISYPTFLIVVALGVVTFMLQVVVPMFQDVYEQMNQELPSVTLFLIQASEFIQSYGILIFLALGLVFFLIYRAWTSEQSKPQFERIVAKVPILGDFYLSMIKSKQTSLLLFLTKAYVPVYNALLHTANSSNSAWSKQGLLKCADLIEQGESLATAMKTLDMYTPSELVLIKLGEETNQLSRSFAQLTDGLQDHLNQHASTLGKTLEPLLIGVVTVFIGVILVALYLPLFNMSY
jgi:type IV pilus assembly protein PilC